MAPGRSVVPLGVYGAVFAIGAVLAFVVTPLAIRLGQRAGMVAEPGGRRQHAGVIPRTGGIPLYVAFTAAFLIGQFFVRWPWQVDEGTSFLFAIVRFDPKEIFRLVGLMVGSSLVFVVGVMDDKFELSPLVLFVTQLVAGGMGILFLIFIEYVNNPFTGLQTDEFPYVFIIVSTLLWIGVMTNTVNWLDGVDGLAGGVVAIACVVLIVNAAFRLEPPQFSVALLPVALLGALVGFLPYNMPPARIFLGGGAYYLGYMMGALSIIGGAKVATMLLVLGLPLLDTFWQIIARLVRGKNPAAGDRGHFHFRLEDIGLTKMQIVLGYYAFCTLFGGLSLVVSSQLYKLIALIVLALLSTAGFLWAARHSPTDIQAPDQELG